MLFKDRSNSDRISVLSFSLSRIISALKQKENQKTARGRLAELHLETISNELAQLKEKYATTHSERLSLREEKETLQTQCEKLLNESVAQVFILAILYFDVIKSSQLASFQTTCAQQSSELSGVIAEIERLKRDCEQSRKEKISAQNELTKITQRNIILEAENKRQVNLPTLILNHFLTRSIHLITSISRSNLSQLLFRRKRMT